MARKMSKSEMDFVKNLGKKLNKQEKLVKTSLLKNQMQLKQLVKAKKKVKGLLGK